ncbi:MAG: M48 family metalloprotease [Burkholderiales bacterium]|nr:M48 family metalloprotease [Burkholderiales bacterium]
MTLGGWQMPVHAQAQAPSPAPTPVQNQVRLPSLGESASEDLSVSDERRLGEQIMNEARRDPQYLDDPVLLEYLQSVFQPLVKAARTLGNIDADTDHVFAWQPFLVKDPSVNAFALPGGYIGVHLGMIAITDNADELASVLAHELSHVTQRHIARSIAPQQHASMVAIAAMLLGIIAASRSSNFDVANAAIMGGQGAAIQSQLNYSRGVEQEADRVGYGVLTAAGYAPSGMAQMFEHLDQATRLNDNGGFPYLRTHPLTSERIAEARNRALLHPGPPPVPTMMHLLMRARARVLMADGEQALQRLAGGSTSPLRIEQVAALYGTALARSALHEGAAADQAAVQALALAETAPVREPRAEAALLQLEAEVRLAAANPAGARQALDRIPATPGSSDRATLLLRGQTELALARISRDTTALRESTAALQIWLADHPDDAIAWDVVAQSDVALGFKLRALRAEAEHRAVLGDLPGAIDRLRAAQAASRGAEGQDFIEASVIDTRLRQLMARRRARELEARGEGRGGRPGDELRFQLE